MMKLFIKVDNRLKLIKISKDETIWNLKKRLTDCPEKISVYWKGRVLDNNQTYEHYAITPLSTITISGNIMGGLPVIAADVTGGITGLIAAVTATSSAATAVNTAQNIWQKAWEAFKNTQGIRQFIMIMAQIQRYLPILFLVLMILSFLAKPVEFIMLTIGIISVTFIYILYSIISLPPFVYIPMSIFFVIHDIVPLIAYSILFGALLLFILVICLVLAAINGITGGALKNLVLCQNSPESWFKTPNFHYTNKYERGIFCSKPCLARYKPDTTGLGCEKLPKAYPAYCPQAEIMRLYTGKRADKAYKFADFNVFTNLKYLKRTPLRREFLLKNHYIEKIKFMNSCKENMSEYNSVALGICSSIDIIPDDKLNAFTSNMSKREINRLRSVCKQAFCNSVNNYPFCSLVGTNNEEDSELIRKIIKLAILIIVFMVIVFFSLKYLL